jgi:monoamine oxidase
LDQAGLKTVVLEAKEVIGGRSRSITRQSGPGIVELGATWINNITQPKVFALTEMFGLETAEQFTHGDSIVQGEDGRVLRFPPGVPVSVSNIKSS